MAKAAARRLRVYRARLGFDDSVVAAPNQGEALKAWGVRQNLFAEGEAEVETDPRAIEAAQAHPGTPLRRPGGGSGPFGLEPKPPSALPPVKRPTASRARAPRRTAPAPAPAPPDRSELDAAERELRRLEAEHAAELEEIERRRRRLQEDTADLERAWSRTRKAAERQVEKARRAYERACGR